jgi:hypothetical protein
MISRTTGEVLLGITEPAAVGAMRAVKLPTTNQPL